MTSGRHRCLCGGSLAFAIFAGVLRARADEASAGAAAEPPPVPPAPRIEPTSLQPASAATTEQAVSSSSASHTNSGSADSDQSRQGQVPSAPTYDLLRDSETKIRAVDEQIKVFEFHGYFRSGFGFTNGVVSKLPFRHQVQTLSIDWATRPRRTPS